MLVAQLQRSCKEVDAEVEDSGGIFLLSGLAEALQGLLPVLLHAALAARIKDSEIGNGSGASPSGRIAEKRGRAALRHKIGRLECRLQKIFHNFPPESHAAGGGREDAHSSQSIVMSYPKM